MTHQVTEELKANSPLGKASNYAMHYTPELLFSMSRAPKRQEIGITDALPFYGYDNWNAYEVSWLNEKGKPVVAMAKITVPANSPCIFESKSLKLYLNSFNNTRFSTMAEVSLLIKKDLSRVTQAEVKVELQDLYSATKNNLALLPGQNIDHLDISTDVYENYPAFLTTGTKNITEELNSDLLKSNCLVTKQPDWGSFYIQYTGEQIQHEGLLKYIISMRNHNEFHEQCIERIFMDITHYCKPKMLTVYGGYTRRGGIDINPFRSTDPEAKMENRRLVRQ